MPEHEDEFSPARIDEQLDQHLRLREPVTRGQFQDQDSVQLVRDLKQVYGIEGTENMRSLQRVWERLGTYQANAQDNPRAVVDRTQPGMFLLKTEQTVLPNRNGHQDTTQQKPTDSGFEHTSARLSHTRPDAGFRHPEPTLPNSRSGHQRQEKNANISTQLTRPVNRFFGFKKSRERVPEATAPIRRVFGIVPGKTFSMLAASLLLVILSGSLFAAIRLLPSLAASMNFQASTPTPTQIPGYLYPAPGKDISQFSSSTPFTAIVWSPDGTRLAAATADAVWLGDPVTGKYTLLQSATDGQIFKALAWSANGQYLAVGSSPVRVYDTSTLTVVASYLFYSYTTNPNDQAITTALSWSPDNNLLAIAWLSNLSGSVVEIRSLSQPADVIWNFADQYSKTGLNSIVWSPDGKAIASSGSESVMVWMPANNDKLLIPTIDINNPTQVAWYSNELLAFVNYSSVRVWNVRQARQVSIIARDASGQLTWSPNGIYIAMNSGNTVEIWDTTVGNGKWVYTYKSHTHTVSVLTWSPDGTSIASAEGDYGGGNVLRVWSA
jgi:WD40 repeat protein